MRPSQVVRELMSSALAILPEKYLVARLRRHSYVHLKRTAQTSAPSVPRTADQQISRVEGPSIASEAWMTVLDAQ